ncbi:hypothetical protein OUZ56_020155 [Daphnia magna]|uniref:Uncharacterized protein n=1 Tax=Daphnia magna TaxID=35525 RepID=A0ABQ9ZES1_9CRUS|nr:hypothetical protein OUZ56_020155 [Daphnia magna]
MFQKGRSFKKVLKTGLNILLTYDQKRPSQATSTYDVSYLTSQKPHKIFKTGTRDQCSYLLITRSQILHALWNNTNELTYVQTYQEAKTDEGEKSGLERNVNREKKN